MKTLLSVLGSILAFVGVFVLMFAGIIGVMWLMYWVFDSGLTPFKV